MPDQPKPKPVRLHELKPDDWPLVDQLFGKRGACGGCWCMHWRSEKGGKTWEAAKGEPNRQAFCKLIKSGKAKGVLALDGHQAVGWCSFGRRSDFPRLDRTKAYQYSESLSLADGLPDPEQVWSINCLFLAKQFRGQGLAGMLVEAAVKAIKKRKGKLIEAYPVTMTAEGNKLPPAFSFTGPEVLFQRLGFTESQRLSRTRPLYHLAVTR